MVHLIYFTSQSCATFCSAFTETQRAGRSGSVIVLHNDRNQNFAGVSSEYQSFF
jgi:hypothetical protein